MSIPASIQKVIETNLSYILAYFQARLWDYFAKRYPNHWLSQVDQVIDLSEIEDQCASYHKETGRGSGTSHTIRQLVRGLLLKYLTASSYRQTEELVDCHMFMKLWVGYGPFEQPFDHTTLQRFDIWVMEHHPRLFFDTINHQLESTPEEKRQFVDTYAMIARAARADVINLLRGASERLLKAIKEVSVSQYDQIVAQLDLKQLYGENREKPNGLLTKAEYGVRIAEVGGQVVILRQAVQPLFAGETPLFNSEDQPEVAQWLAYLDKIMTDELDVSHETVKELPAKKKGSYRLVALNDPEATMRIHGEATDLGYNVSTLTDDHFVREIQVDTGSTPDNLALGSLLASQKEHRGFVPDEVGGDRAYGTGKVRAEVSEATDGQTQVVAYLPDFEGRREQFGPSDFEVDDSLPDKPVMTCPNGQTTDKSYRHGQADGRTFRFTAKHHCADCPLWNKCRGEEGKPTAHRTVFISDYREEIAQARLFNQTEEFKVAIEKRPVVERIIFNLTNIHGGRVARSVGRVKAEYQSRMAAVAFNIRQLVRLKLATS